MGEFESALHKAIAKRFVHRMVFCLQPIWDGRRMLLIGIGAAITDCAPATPPGMRVRTGRFEKGKVWRNSVNGIAKGQP